MALKKTSITIPPAMEKDESRNGFDQKRSSRIETVYERYHAIIDTAEAPDLSEQEFSFLRDLIENGLLAHHPALPLGRVVERAIEDLILKGEAVDVEIETLIKKLTQMTRAEEMALVEVAEIHLAQLQKSEKKEDPMSSFKAGS